MVKKLNGIDSLRLCMALLRSMSVCCGEIAAVFLFVPLLSCVLDWLSGTMWMHLAKAHKSLQERVR